MAQTSNSRMGLGRRGERLAAEYLLRQGYRVLETNARTASGEIDLVALDNGVLALVEVRTRRGRSLGTPEESITLAKQERLRRAAAEYHQAHLELPSDYRIDVVGVELTPAGRLIRIELIKAAVGEA